MKKLIFTVSVLFLLVSLRAQSTKEQSINEINKTVWNAFIESFATDNYKLFESIHSTDLFRVPADGDTIFNFGEYMQQSVGTFNYIRDNEVTRHIDLRFIERINNGELASETGIYEFTVDKGTNKEKSYYGKFHVLLRKENGVWKILSDYDSNYENTINEEDFKSAHPIEYTNYYYYSNNICCKLV
jgi:ketosteroid isomerase-like protein